MMQSKVKCTGSKGGRFFYALFQLTLLNRSSIIGDENLP
jgi:hypothetical protein